MVRQPNMRIWLYAVYALNRIFINISVIIVCEIVSFTIAFETRQSILHRLYNVGIESQIESHFFFFLLILCFMYLRFDVYTIKSYLYNKHKT